MTGQYIVIIAHLSTITTIPVISTVTECVLSREYTAVTINSGHSASWASSEYIKLVSGFAEDRDENEQFRRTRFLLLHLHQNHSQLIPSLKYLFALNACRNLSWSLPVCDPRPGLWWPWFRRSFFRESCEARLLDGRRGQVIKAANMKHNCSFS